MFIIINCMFISSKDLRVVNCNSGGRNGITYREFLDRIVKYARKYPSKYTLLYPSVSVQLNPIAHGLRQAFHSYLPAYVCDFRSRLMGRKPQAVVAQDNLKSVTLSGTFWCYEISIVFFI